MRSLSNWKKTTEESKVRWEKNADFWDEKMGEHSNRFHREIVRPSTEKLLAVRSGERILDVACGNGNFSGRLAELGAEVVALDYSENLIRNARKRCKAYGDQIDFRVMDATDYSNLMKLGEESFDKAVANMALMDIADIQPLLEALHELLKPEGIFVFSIMHPCFQTPGMRRIMETEDRGSRIERRSGVQIFSYRTPVCYEGNAIDGQPVPQLYYHRSLSEILHQSFAAGFVLDEMEEPCFSSDETDWVEIPPAMVLRLRKS
ncbi:class I SAM-dependent methyltransferase [Proteiniclasticum sp. C24MP]|uniref:class I SAM-dependent methyltransferase n=1 Tax=Proteiniclasticum sp. C24MP TaxID=3374101 RepID=UPI003754ACAD